MSALKALILIVSCLVVLLLSTLTGKRSKERMWGERGFYKYKCLPVDKDQHVM